MRKFLLNRTGRGESNEEFRFVREKICISLPLGEKNTFHPRKFVIQ